MWIKKGDIKYIYLGMICVRVFPLHPLEKSFSLLSFSEQASISISIRGMEGRKEKKDRFPSCRDWCKWVSLNRPKGRSLAFCISAFIYLLRRKNFSVLLLTQPPTKRNGETVNWNRDYLRWLISANEQERAKNKKIPFCSKKNISTHHHLFLFCRWFIVSRITEIVTQD